MLAIDNNSVEAVSLLLKYGALLSDAVMREMVLEYAVKKRFIGSKKQCFYIVTEDCFFVGNLLN